MGRNLNRIIAGLPSERRAGIDARHRELRREVESLGALRRIAGRAQADIATALDIRQPSVSKIERQADIYLSTLRGYVSALGGTLELRVTLPDQPPLIIQRLGDIAGIAAGARQPPTRRPVARGGSAAKLAIAPKARGRRPVETP